MNNILAEETWQIWTAPQGKDGDLAGHITIANHRGVTLFGKALQETLPQVPIEDYRESILSDYYWLLENNLANQVYGILNMCRIWQHLETGAVSSKDEGAVWALEYLPAEYHALVRGMLESYRNDAEMPDNEAAISSFSVFIEQKLKELGA
jgi:streptomycin 3"-adenylyltransferase